MFKTSTYRWLTLTLLLTGGFAHAQELTKETAWAIKYGSTNYLDQWIADDQLNDCLGVRKSKKYNYLAMSIKLKSMASLKYFLDRGTDIEGNCAEKSPLMYAAKYGQAEMLKYLIEQGADPNRVIKGKTAYYFARKFKQWDIARTLRSYRIDQ